MRHRSNIVALIDADVGYNVVGAACMIGRSPEGVPHGDKTAEVVDAVRISVAAIVDRPNARKELIDEPERREQIASGNGHRLHWGLNLASQRETAECKNAQDIDEFRSVSHGTSFDQDLQKNDFRDTVPS
jgi:hypothetical protein